MIRLTYVTLDCADAEVLAHFWSDALGWNIEYLAEDGAVLADPSGAPPRLFLQPVAEPKTVKNRMHPDLTVSDLDAEEARLVKLGAIRRERHDVPEGRRSYVMADPEGNEFCLNQA
jgi:predicted enzyme related to lactoylglutathione lyase